MILIKCVRSFVHSPSAANIFEKITACPASLVRSVKKLKKLIKLEKNNNKKNRKKKQIIIFFLKIQFDLIRFYKLEFKNLNQTKK
jgi:hypothetical protein